MIYRSANMYYKERFGCKLYKAAVSLDVTCPNRDGTVGDGGCIFCSAGGSGEFASQCRLPIAEQIDTAIDKVHRKAGDGAGYIAYFQSFTSTYCDPGYLRRALEEAGKHPLIKAISVATRPDCLPDDILDVLSETNGKIPLFVELGLQTANDKTAELINRGYKTELYAPMVRALHAKGINVITHVIFALPGETQADMMNTVKAVSDAGTDGVKFTCLYVLKGTKLEKMWKNGDVAIPSMEEYFDIVDNALKLLSLDTVIHRMTGDGPKSLLLAPMWTSDKRRVINYINSRFCN